MGLCVCVRVSMCVCVYLTLATTTDICLRSTLTTTTQPSSVLRGRLAITPSQLCTPHHHTTASSASEAEGRRVIFVAALTSYPWK